MDVSCSEVGFPVLLLQDCNQLSEQGFALVPGFSNLQYLWVDGCSRASVAVLMAIAACPSLAALEVHRLTEGQSFSRECQLLLSKVKGPKLEVVVHGTGRSLGQIMPLQPMGTSGGGAGGGTGGEGGGGGGYGERKGGWLGLRRLDGWGLGEGWGAVGMGGVLEHEGGIMGPLGEVQVQMHQLQVGVGALVLDAHGAAIL
jgi:hypothetical protein